MAGEEVLIQTETVRVRVMHLAPGEVNEAHFHNEVTDHFVGLTGEIVVQFQEPEALKALGSGQRCTVEAGQVHRVSNGSHSQPASYLLIQGVGRYDFNPLGEGA